MPTPRGTLPFPGIRNSVDWSDGTGVNPTQGPVDALRLRGEGFADVVIVDATKNGQAYAPADWTKINKPRALPQNMVKLPELLGRPSTSSAAC
jgi:hypothetical protein